ncbi:MAG TPA: hypothetical protein VJ521_13675 [Acidobacteriota bacterium]|nr:hypothetical protein [Acidobacteriota bacterium]
MSYQLRYDDIPWEEFSSVLKAHIDHPAKKLLISEFKLRDFMLICKRNRLGHFQLDSDTKKNREVVFYFLREPDPAHDTIHQYLIITTDTDGAEELAKIGQRIRLDLRAKGIETLFRIDPRYGLIVGSSLRPVSRYTVKDRPQCFLTLVWSSDPSHLLVSLQDYLDREDRPRYHKIFEQYNHVPPGKASVLKRLFSPQAAQRASTGWNYHFLSEFVAILDSRYYIFPWAISMIFENIHDDEFEATVLDRKRSSSHPGGINRFFISTEELLQ